VVRPSGGWYTYIKYVSDLIVICDDLDLPLGTSASGARAAAGTQGHELIIAALGSQEFARIKIGIGRPAKEDGTPVSDEDAIVDYVLSDFTRREEAVIEACHCPCRSGY